MKTARLTVGVELTTFRTASTDDDKDYRASTETATVTCKCSGRSSFIQTGVVVTSTFEEKLSVQMKPTLVVSLFSSRMRSQIA